MILKKANLFKIDHKIKVQLLYSPSSQNNYKSVKIIHKMNNNLKVYHIFKINLINLKVRNIKMNKTKI